MIGRLSEMADPPPPSEPPAGWYPDPTGAPGHRWWNGSAWSDHHAPPGAGPPGPPPSGSASPPPATTGAVLGSGAPPPPTPGTVLGFGAQPPRARLLPPIGEWLSESVRFGASRAGHYLPLVLFLVLTTSVATSVAVFYGVDGTVVRLLDSGEAEFEFAGSTVALYTAIALFGASMVLVPLLKASVAYQVVAARSEKPEAWSDSLQRAVRRGRRIVGASLVRTGLYWVLLLGTFLAVGAAPVLVLLFPLVIGLLFFAWFRLSMVGISAALGPADEHPFRRSWELTGVAPGPTLGRIVLLAVIAFNLLLAANFVLAPVFLLISTGQTDEPTATDVIRLGEQIGPTPAMAALRSFINGLGLGANYILAAVGSTLLYLQLGGVAVEPAPTAPGPDPEAAASWPPTADPQDGPTPGSGGSTDARP